MSLVGVVGGTVGMFAGFSFVGIAEWLMEVASVKLLELTKSGKAKKSGQME